MPAIQNASTLRVRIRATAMMDSGLEAPTRAAWVRFYFILPFNIVF